MFRGQLARAPSPTCAFGVPGWKERGCPLTYWSSVRETPPFADEAAKKRAEGKGFDFMANPAEKKTSTPVGGAKSGALNEELAIVEEAWPGLPEKVRRQIVHLCRLDTKIR